MEKNMVNWFMVPATNFKRAVKFYNKIFDLNMQEMKDPDGSKMAFFLDPETKAVNGGISSNPKTKPSMNGTRVYLNANGKLDKVINRVNKAGGKVTVPKMHIGKHGYVGMIVDTEGNQVGLHSAT